MGEPVPGRQDRDERVRDEVVIGERAGGRGVARAGPVVDEGEVDLAGADAREALGGGVLLAEHHGELGVAAQPAHDRPGEGDGDGGEGGDGDPAARFGGVGGEIGLGLGDGVEDGPGVLDEAAPGVGQLGRARGAFQERHTGLPLQGRQLLRYGGGGLSCRDGGGRDRSVGGELVEQPQASHIQHK
ncbi:MAG TPA: hypothetical protein VKZ65_07600 [Glycomyces sp.]|nr:hypothetical protein [Glycomyces sp.]